MKKFNKQEWIAGKNREKLTALQFDQHVDYSTKALLAKIFQEPVRFQYVGNVSDIKPEWNQLSIKIDSNNDELQELCDHLGLDLTSFPGHVTTPFIQNEKGEVEIRFKNRLLPALLPATPVEVGDLVALEASMKAYLAYGGKHGIYFEIEKMRKSWSIFAKH